MATQAADPLAWWREARFGMFIHWGLYALPAGQWQGERVSGLGEWIMRNGKIPIAEYEALARDFNPVEFDADAWVRLAKRAGMKYLVITAKHHDGFAMYHSPSNSYNIVDATPFGRDPMAELAAACASHGVRLCFYYSQAQDWHAPGGAGHWEEAGEHGWWAQPVEPERFQRYLDEKVVPQVTELLTQYGPIGLIWFDTPVVITEAQSRMLRELVHSLQPDCLVSGRVGHNVGDYGSLGDNQIPRGPVQGDWETPATLNDTWGFRSDDHHWKSVRELLELLVDLASKGVNYLLNVGPTAEGVIPPESVELLQAIGAWMDVNGAAIRGTQPSPWPYEFDWGRVTAKGDRLYLLCTTWPNRITLTGLRSQVCGARLLGHPGSAVPVVQHHDAVADQHTVVLELPATAPDEHVSVIELTLDGAVDVDPALSQQPGGSVVLPAYLAERTSDPEAPLTVTPAGTIAGWRTTGSAITWRFRLLAPGPFAVRVVLGPVGYNTPAAGGQTVTVVANDARVSGVLTANEPVESPRTLHFPERAATLGTLTLAQPGWCELSLRADALPEGGEPLTVSAVELVPAG